MKGLSKKEIEIVSDLEFNKKYYFTVDDIKNHFINKKQMINSIYNLRKKGRIVNLSRNKYYLVPIKARTGKWAEDDFILIDELFNSKDYFISNWAAANYWRLTEQIPMKFDVHTTKRQGKVKVLNTPIIFHRTTKKRIQSASVIRKISDHEFRIMSKEKTRKWIKSRR
jgi:predicted transcriptional regulator of viral defense system